MNRVGRVRGSKRRIPTGTFAWERTSESSVAFISTGDDRQHLSHIPYLLPKDVSERNRLDFQFYLIRSILHGNYVSPLRNDLTSILDVGCGTGHWVIEMACAFPAAQMVGLDIEPPFQSAQAVPSNVRFVQANLLNGLPFADCSFDFTYQRLMELAIPAAQWPGVVGELVRVTHPSGSVELLEGGDVFLHAGPATQRFLAWWRDASYDRGVDISFTKHLGRLLLDAHMRNVQVRTLQVPVDKWGGRIGALLEKNILAGFLALKPLLCSQLFLSSQEFDTTMAELATEGDCYHTRYQYYLTYGQR